MTSSTASIGSKALRIVFFGEPGSGKTELVGRVARAAWTDPNVNLATPPEPRQVRHAEPTRFVEVRMPEFRTQIQASGPSPIRDLVLIDCDGRAVAELLADPDPLLRSRNRGELADALGVADAVVVVIDANEKWASIDRTMTTLIQFLNVYEVGRSLDRKAGGLPILMTLSKCDLLISNPNDPQDWLEQIDANRRQIRERFEEFFQPQLRPLVDDSEQDDDESKIDPGVQETEEDASEQTDPPNEWLTFGSIGLSSHETASSLPSTSMFRLYLDESGGGFGVRKLTDAVIAKALDYRRRCDRSRRRLRITTGMVGLLLLAMLFASLGLALFVEPGPLERLSRRVRKYQNIEGPPEVRLADRQLDRHRHELETFRDSAYFTQLPEDLQQYVRIRLDESTRYESYRLRFRPPQFSPADVRRRIERDRLLQDLSGPLAPPADYADAWKETEAVRLHNKWHRDLQLLDVAEERLHDWYRSLIRRATNLMIESPSPVWRERVVNLLQEAERPPFPAAEPIPGSPSVPVRRGGPVTYAAAYRYERTDAARHDWETTAVRIGDLRDLCTAFGLIPDPLRSTPLLRLPEPSADPASSSLLPTQLLNELKTRFPRSMDGGGWQANEYPDPVRTELTRRIRDILETSGRHVARLVSAMMNLPQGQADRPGDWARVIELLKRPALRDWGRLLAQVRRWSGAAVAGEADPIRELAAFLEQDKIIVTVDTLELTIPNSLRVNRQFPDGPLTITITADGRATSYEFKQEGPGRSVGTGVLYRFVNPSPTPATLTIRPGDGIVAELPLRSDGGKSRLVWDTSRTATYQIERLTTEPWLQRAGTPPLRDRATDVLLQMTTKTPTVRIPELLPSLAHTPPG